MMIALSHGRPVRAPDVAHLTSTERLTRFPDLECPGCGAQAWFVRASSHGRSAKFAAHHDSGCTESSRDGALNAPETGANDFEENEAEAVTLKLGQRPQREGPEVDGAPPQDEPRRRGKNSSVTEYLSSIHLAAVAGDEWIRSSALVALEGAPLHVPASRFFQNLAEMTVRGRSLATACWGTVHRYTAPAAEAKTQSWFIAMHRHPEAPFRPYLLVRRYGIFREALRRIGQDGIGAMVGGSIMICGDLVWDKKGNPFIDFEDPDAVSLIPKDKLQQLQT